MGDQPGPASTPAISINVKVADRVRAVEGIGSIARRQRLPFSSRIHERLAACAKEGPPSDYWALGVRSATFAGRARSSFSTISLSPGGSSFTVLQTMLSSTRW